MRNMPWHCVAEISKTVSEKMTACVISSTVQFIKSQLCKLAMSSMLIHPRNSTDAGFPMSFSLVVDCWSDSWIVLHDSRCFSLTFWDFMNYAMKSSARHFFSACLVFIKWEVSLIEYITHCPHPWVSWGQLEVAAGELWNWVLMKYIIQ